MSDQPKPTVGRVVLFKSSDAAIMGNGAKVVPAIVVAVFGDTCNLRVLSDGPNTPWVASVGFQEDIEEFEPQFSVYGEGTSTAWINHQCGWGWMPYQKAVHAGTVEPTKHAS